MEKFDNILKQIAQSEGVHLDEVRNEMQRAIQEAYSHRDESNQVLWGLLSNNGECPSIEDFIYRASMLLETGYGPLQ